MDLGRNSWFTAKHEATISGPYPHHVYFTGNTWLFFCTASAAVKVNQSGDISYQNLKVGKICLQCEAPRWCFWFVYKSSNYNSIPHKPTELYPQVSAHVSHKYWVAVAHIVHICKHYILKGMCMYIYIFVYIYIFDYICIYIHIDTQLQVGTIYQYSWCFHPCGSVCGDLIAFFCPSGIARWSVPTGFPAPSWALRWLKKSILEVEWPTFARKSGI